ncbi:LysR family transcriptional regulator [Alcaligenaceae bacterium]|nr:LysR family transcriptional regulator [Alcaligenaceae bacterium]
MRNGIPNLGALQAFEATARLGSFSRAAEELALTHSAVYRQVAGLEERLGVALFTRVRRRVKLTDAGEEYAGRVRHHLDQLEKDTLGLMSRAGVGRNLHVAVLPTLATTWLLPRLAAFGRERPDITISLSVRTLPFQFNDQPFDAAIYHAEQMWPGTRGIKLFDERELLPICAPAMLEAAGDRHQMADMVHLHTTSRPDAWRRWYQAQGRDFLPTMNAGPRYELFTMSLAAVKQGMGVALIPRFLVQHALDSGELVMPVDAGLRVREAYFFSYPIANATGEALRDLERWLEESAA